jgi:8-oxo-dGTP diphosphatase
MKQKVQQRIAMKAVIVKDDKVLIIREAETYGDGTQIGRYHMPGGRIEPGEHFEKALRREVREETGLEIEIDYPLYIGEWHPVIKGVPHQIIAVFSVCTPKSSRVTLSNEHDDYQWIEPKKRKDFDIMDPEDKVLDRLTEITTKHL